MIDKLPDELLVKIWSIAHPELEEHLTDKEILEYINEYVMKKKVC